MFVAVRMHYSQSEFSLYLFILNLNVDPHLERKKKSSECSQILHGICICFTPNELCTLTLRMLMKGARSKHSSASREEFMHLFLFSTLRNMQVQVKVCAKESAPEQEMRAKGQV